MSEWIDAVLMLVLFVCVMGVIYNLCMGVYEWGCSVRNNVAKRRYNRKLNFVERKFRTLRRNQ